jgi:hypothetical protein
MFQQEERACRICNGNKELYIYTRSLHNGPRALKSSQPLFGTRGLLARPKRSTKGIVRLVTMAIDINGESVHC